MLYQLSHIRTQTRNPGLGTHGSLTGFSDPEQIDSPCHRSHATLKVQKTRRKSRQIHRLPPRFSRVPSASFEAGSPSSGAPSPVAPSLPHSLRGVSNAPIPEDFTTALLSLRDAAHPLVMREEIPAPSRLAPWSAALAIRTQAEAHDEALGLGRFIVLHDPDGQAGWNGDFRLVMQLRAQIDAEMGTDPLLSEALWHWAHDCLDERGAGFHDLTGTVTREMSESFGGLILRGSTLYVEIRTSLTPNTPWIGEHLLAWQDFMCRITGVDSHRFLEGA